MLAGVAMPPGITVLGFRSRRAVKKKKKHVFVRAYFDSFTVLWALGESCRRFIASERRESP